MTTVAEEVATFMVDYKAADPTLRSAKREYSLFELFKWEAVRAEIRKIDMEAV
jgi:hypothetical protein